MREQAGWVEKGSADNALATATRLAASGKQHIIFAVDASFSGVVVDKLMQIKDGTTVIWEGYVDNQRDKTFPAGIAATIGAAVSAELAASGVGGMIGKVNLHGVTS